MSERQEGSSVFVGGFPFSTTQDELAELFRAHGTVVGVKLVMDRETGRSKGFGFVDLASPEEAAAAQKALNGFVLGGRKLFVNIARPKEERPEGKPGGAVSTPAYTGPERRSGRDRRVNPGFGSPASASRPFGEGKPWAKREGGFALKGTPSLRSGEKKPWQKREGAPGEKKPWQKREGGFDKKPWQKREGAPGEKKPWEKREGGFEKKPWQKREGGFEKKPWQKREGAPGEKKPWEKREGGFEKKPWDKKPGGGLGRKKWGPGGPSSGKKPGQFKRKPGFGFGGGKPGRRSPD